MLAIYIDTNQFRVEDDHTEEFKTGRRIKAYCNVDGYVYSTVLSSIYSDSYTTITIVENVLTSNLEDVLYGIVNIGETGAFPDHLHDGTEGQGGVLPHITATEFSTYSGTLQTQINNKPDTFLELLDTPPIYDSEKYAQSTGSGIIWSPITQSFLDLTDTPTTYSEHLDELLKVTSSGIDFVQLPAYNMFTAASGLPLDGNPLDVYLNFSTGDVYKYDLGASSYDTTKFNIPSMTHVASHTLNGDVVNLSDGSNDTYWQTYLDAGNPEWVSIDLGVSKTIYKVLLQGSVSDRLTKNFRIEGSSNNTDWDVVYTGITVMNFDPQEFIFPAFSAPYRYWRLYMIDNWGISLFLMTRFELYAGISSYSYSWQVQGNVRTTPAFKDLTDTPNTYSGTEGLFAQSTGSGIVWATASGSGYWYDGYSTPSGSLGVVNDYYINSTTNKIYKKQSSGSTFFTAKSVIIDMTNNWTDGSYVGLRSVELYLSGSKVSTPLSALTGYDTSASFDPIHAFKNEVVKTGSSTTTNGWTSDPGSVTNQRIVCVFSSPVTFDSMVINNYHHTGVATTRGAKDINVYYSTDAITTATYGGAISNSALIFTGQLHQHAASDAADNQTLTLINNYSVGWNVVLNTVNSFSGLVDAPSTYSGTGGMFAQSTGSGIMWTTISGGSSNVQSFLDLTDVPHTYTNTVGKFAQSTGSGIVWTTVSAGSSDIQTFLDLTDTPNEYSEGLFAQSTASGIVWATLSGGGSSDVQSFLDLSDTPSSYSGYDGRYVKVVGDTLEFVAISEYINGTSDSSDLFELDEYGGIMPVITVSGTSSDIQSFLDLTDTPDTYSGTVGLFAQSTGSGISWSEVQSGPPTSGTWNFEEATLSGTGDVCCHNLYLDDIKVFIEDCTILVESPGELADEYTVLMLHMDGDNNSTTFTDSASHNYQVTTLGNAHISTTLSKFGGASALFDGTDDRITIPASADFSFGTSPFTIDFWINFTSIAGYQYFFDIGNDNSEFYYYTGNWYIRNPNSTNILSYAYTPTIDVWYHVAIGRSGNTWYLFMDGALKTTSSSSAAFGISNLVFSIGNYGGGGGYGFNGYMDEFRVSKGILRWSDTFTPQNRAYVEAVSPFSKELAYTDHIHTFIELIDTPSIYSDGLFAKSTTSGIVWATVSGGEANSDHGLLTGLTDDDHPQYVRHDLAIAENDFLVGAPSPFGTFNKKSLNETRELLGVTGSGIVLSQTFLDLTDTPNSYSDGLYAKSTTSGIEWATVSGGTSSVQSFIDLTDTPNEYSSGKFAQSTSDGIIWTTVSGGTGASYGELELSYSANIVLDFTTYNLQSVLLSGNTSFTFTNMTNAKPCILNVIQDAQGSRAATFQSNVKWPQGVIPTTSSGSGLNDIYTFIQSRGTIYGDCVKAFQLGS